MRLERDGHGEEAVGEGVEPGEALNPSRFDTPCPVGVEQNPRKEPDNMQEEEEEAA